MSKTRVGIFIGSLRKNSFSRIVANAIIERNTFEYEFEIVETGNLPLYNEDIDVDNSAFDSYRQQVQTFDAYIFVTPEYNRSIPGNLKNALDIGSRPPGQSAFAGKKPTGIISVSPGRLSAFGANHHLRQVLSFLDLSVMAQPETYIGNISNAVNDGEVVDERTLKALDTFMRGFNDWFHLLKKA